MRHALRGAMILCAMVLTLVSSGVRAEEIPLITGEHWTKATDVEKKSYLIGIANIIQVELAYAGSAAPSEAQSILPRFARGLKGHSLDSVRQGLDKWYAANPQRLQRPVVETIWFEMVVPGLQKTN